MDSRPRNDNIKEMIVSPDKYHRLDGSVLRIAQNINTELPIIPLTRIDDFVFNDLLLNYNQAVILDYCELEWNWDYEKTGSHIFGVNTNNFPFFRGEEWKKLWNSLSVGGSAER